MFSGGITKSAQKPPPQPPQHSSLGGSMNPFDDPDTSGQGSASIPLSKSHSTDDLEDVVELRLEVDRLKDLLEYARNDAREQQILLADNKKTYQGLLAEARACRCVMANTYSVSRSWSSSPGHSWTSTVALSVHKSAPSRPLKSQSCWSAANLPLWNSPNHRCTRAADHLDGLGLVSSYAAPFASPPLSAWQTSSNMS